MRARFLAVVVTLLTALAIGAGPAAASTGGTPDGNTHPNVGLILFYQPDGRFRCSATLISPTVLLTAAHCTDADLGSVLVDFRSVVALQPPNGYPVAADAAVGYTDAEINAAGFLSGTAYTHPEYSHFTDLDNWNDVGVVVLDQPVTGMRRLSSPRCRRWTPSARTTCARRSSPRSATAPRCASRTRGRRSRRP